ncbi:MAG TPA: hypothetical protein VM682_01930, partial [Bacillus sp. (in: firmicutes)]|nr:hypothetical protein [Bacillus sp. (in: firmicutes)]
METDLSGQFTSSSLETSPSQNITAASSQTAPITKTINNQNTRSPNDPLITNSGNSPLVTPISQINSLSQQQRTDLSPKSPVNNAPNPSRSRHNPVNRDIMEDDIDNDPELDVALNSDVIRFRAATSFSDVIRDKETKAMCKNRLKDYFITRYTDDFVNLHLIGASAVRKVVLIFSTPEASTKVTTDDHDELKQTEEAIAPSFHPYDPAAVSAAIRERTLSVTDIPLFFTASELVATFKRHGLIENYKFKTPKGSNFQQADVIFEETTPIAKFDKVWCVWSQGHCLRVYPATLTPEEKKERMLHVAVLKNLPPDIKAIDLGRIYSEINAASIGLPRYVGSYKSKPWAYFAFKSQELRDLAMEISLSLKGRKLSWILPNEVKDLCVRCASSEHKTQKCTAFEDRGRKPIPKAIQNNYDRFKPVGYKKPKDQPQGDKTSNRQTKSSSKSRSRSRSRSHSSKNKKKENSDPKEPKTVTYADMASESLNSSDHSPKNRNINKDNNRASSSSSSSSVP